MSAERPSLPPVRLNSEAELARDALAAPLFVRAVRLARWAGPDKKKKKKKKVDDDGAEGAPRRVVLDLSRPRALAVRVTGPLGSRTQRLSPRHAEMLYALAVHRQGRSASELARDIFGDGSRTVTVRAEVSRLRRQLAEVLEHRPYRFGDGVEVEVIHPEDRADLLPHSRAPVVAQARRPAATA